MNDVDGHVTEAETAVAAIQGELQELIGGTQNPAAAAAVSALNELAQALEALAGPVGAADMAIGQLATAM
jgi:hypothetical protein